MVRQALDGLPAGPYLVAPGAEVGGARSGYPKGEAYSRVEGPRGEVGCYLDRQWERQTIQDEMARRVVLQSGRAAAHHSRAQEDLADVVAIMGSVESGIRRGQLIIAVHRPQSTVQGARRGSIGSDHGPLDRGLWTVDRRPGTDPMPAWNSPIIAPFIVLNVVIVARSTCVWPVACRHM